MNKKIYWYILIILVLIFVYFLKVGNIFYTKTINDYPKDYFGVTFSTKFSEELGLEWKEVYLAMLDDLKIKEVRIPVYWDEIEKEPGVFTFSDYDYIFQEGAKRNVKFIANVGWRLPRWPECHAPVWAKQDDIKFTQEKALEMIKVVVERYKNNEAIILWQVENEPLLNTFGICPKSDEDFLRKEIYLVKKLDDRPVLVSATGELSSWRKEAKLGDVFGSTVYRVVWNKLSGYIHYPIPAWFYRFKANLAGIEPNKRVVIELQAEPWTPVDDIRLLTEREINKSFSVNQFKRNVQYALNIGFNKTYLWGVEWWYWQNKQGNNKYWEIAKLLFN